MKDVGSIFPLYKKDLQHREPLFEAPENCSLFSLCREALCVIAHKGEGNKVILLPAYTCDTVITPFLEADWKCCYYSINKDLTIDVESVKSQMATCQPDLFLAHPYYGMDLTSEEVDMMRELHDRGVKLIVDLTQCIYSKQHFNFVDYYVGSYRKWYQVPDGGYLWSKEMMDCGTLEDNEQFVQQQTDAMYLRGVYFENGDEEIKKISIRLNKIATSSVDFNVHPHAISGITLQIMPHLNHEAFVKQRMLNYMYLFDNLSDCKNVELVCKDICRVTTAPLYFTIYTSHREGLQKELAKNHVYAPIIWPVYYEDVIISDTIRHIYNTILAIPIDQRYDEEDMKRITTIIKNIQN